MFPWRSPAQAIKEEERKGKTAFWHCSTDRWGWEGKEKGEGENPLQARCFARKGKKKKGEEERDR